MHTTCSLPSPLLRAYTRFLLASQAYFSFSSPSLAFFRPAFFLRTDLQFVLYLRAVSAGAVRPKLTPPHLRTVTMTTRALKKGERLSSQKIVAEEEWGRASELVKEMCVNVSVVKKKASHKRGDLFFALLNASHLKSHQTWGWG